MTRAKKRPSISLRDDYIHIEMEHCLINIWHERDPQTIEIQPDRTYAGEPKFHVELGKDKTAKYLNMRIVEDEEE